MEDIGANVNRASAIPGSPEISPSMGVIELPDDALPSLEELRGDLRLLAEIVGVRLALRVAQVVDGTPLRIYGGRRWVRRYRDRLMRKECDAGEITVVDLARRYSLTERQTYNILGKAEPDERQMPLFR